MPSAPPPAKPMNAEQRRHHELRTTLTTMRLQTQFLRRLARRQEGIAWQRMVDGLEAIDADISVLLRQVDDDS